MILHTYFNNMEDATEYAQLYIAKEEGGVFGEGISASEQERLNELIKIGGENNPALHTPEGKIVHDNYSNSEANREKDPMLEVDWNDYGDKVRDAETEDEFDQAMSAEINRLVRDKVYSRGTKYVDRVGGGLGTSNAPIITITTPTKAKLFDFYTAYNGGDREAATDILANDYGVTPPNA